MHLPRLIMVNLSSQFTSNSVKLNHEPAKPILNTIQPLCPLSLQGTSLSSICSLSDFYFCLSPTVKALQPGWHLALYLAVKSNVTHAMIVYARHQGIRNPSYQTTNYQHLSLQAYPFFPLLYVIHSPTLLLTLSSSLLQVEQVPIRSAGLHISEK